MQVECSADVPGRSEEEIAIDIVGRDPSDHVGGIPYRLLGEACIPAINVTDIGAIFEEHRVCTNLSVWQHSHDVSVVVFILLSPSQSRPVNYCVQQKKILFK